MNGKIIGIGMIAITAAFAAGVYYTQVYHYYDDIPLAQIELTNLATGTPEPILADDINAIDADSSPIRFRACFTTTMSDAMLTETFEVFEGAEPRNAPNWFDCFDAAQIGADLSAGNAIAFTGTRNIEFGIDRVVAIYPDGRGFAWHQINDCGDKLYDGSPASDDCPERD